MLRIFLAILFIFCVNTLLAQKQQTLRSVVIQGDTIPQVILCEVVVKAKMRNDKWYNKYNRRNARLEYNVRKVYPYARIAATKIKEIEHKLTQASKESERRAILKEEYAQLMKTFKAPLMKLSITQGRILVRLIYRETNNTSFAHIREYKGTVNAYFWQSVARLFGNNLKAAYDPYGDDSEIEEIVRRIEQK